MRPGELAARSITARAGASSPAGLSPALGWWVIGFPLAVAYFVVLFRIYCGKAVAAGKGGGF